VTAKTNKGPRAKRFAPRAKAPEDGYKVMLRKHHFYLVANGVDLAGPFDTEAQGARWIREST
jgi:hypothetical protein